MANEIGNALLSSLTRSTFDIGNMSKTLAEAEVAGPRAILERGQEKTSTELDALKYLKGNLEAFNTYVTDLTSPNLFSQKNATSSDESIVSVTSTGEASLASYQIESKQLSQAHTLVANTVFSSPSDTLSTGDLSIQVSGQTHTIPVTAANNTLEGLQKVINNGDYGVTASIINNGGSYQMMFSSKQTGAAGEVNISGLAGFDAGSGDFTTTAEAQDAVMVLNGLTVTSSTNRFDGVIEGMNFQLKSASPGVQQTVNIEQDSEAVTAGITSFVEVYNQLGTILEELGKYDTSDLTEAELESEQYQYYGDLAGSSLLRTVETQVKESLRGILEGLSGGSYQTLADIGISLNLEGGLDVDDAKLNDVIANNMQAVSDLFSRGGSSDDALVNILAGNENTQAGDYSLNITQLAERATLSGASTAATISNDERLAGDRITDMNAALIIDANATFDLNVGGVTNSIDLSSLSSGNYDSKEEVATAIQGIIDAGFGAGIATIAYDSTQARFEISAEAGQGAISITSTTNMLNQGFGLTSYVGEKMLDVGGVATDAQFDVSVDGSTASTVTIAQGRYTLDELASSMQNNINSNSEVQLAGAEVSVTHDGDVISVTSTRFGIASTLELTAFSDLTNAGFTADLAPAVGQNVDGTITTVSGELSIGAYADAEDGRKISISNYAVINGEAAEVRGLEFEVLGGLFGIVNPLGEPRGTISFTEGFASQLEETINSLFEADSGLIAQRMENLSTKQDLYTEKAKDIDERYDMLLTKYQMQFSMLQSIMSSTEQTRNYLTATFSNNNNN